MNIYFFINTVHKPHEGTAIFPVHMELKFKVAESLEGGRKNDFKHYMRRMKEQIKRFQHSSLIEGTTGRALKIYDLHILLIYKIIIQTYE